MQVPRSDGSTIEVELMGADRGPPVLVCHGLADSRISARLLDPAARELSVRLVAPDRPGTGRTDLRPLTALEDWAGDAVVVLDALGIKSVSLLAISGGAPFAAACAAALPERVRKLVLVSPLGSPAWGTKGMASGERLSFALATRAPGFGARFLSGLAAIARRSPSLFLRIATTDLPHADRQELARPEARAAFLDGYVEAFHWGSAGVAQDLRLLTSAWRFDPARIRARAYVHHGELDATVPPEHARRYAAAIPDAQLRLHPQEGHFSLLGAFARELLAPVAVPCVDTAARC